MRNLAVIETENRQHAQSLDRHRAQLHTKYNNRLVVDKELSRSIVSFQANKSTPFYRWLKYKEAFSSSLVHHFIEAYRPVNNKRPAILDPFAGAGTSLTTATKEGWAATGIELLPVGIAAMKARLKADDVKIRSFSYYLNRFKKYFFKYKDSGYRFPHLRITQNAFSEQTEDDISRFMLFIYDIENPDVRFLFWFACLSILEEVSYTRKDGQYLRWDFRSGRSLKSEFNKGYVPDFQEAMQNKLAIMLEDLKGRNGGSYSRNVNIIQGSCLYELSHLSNESFDMILTSPPYCNRYDYTRTYALELAFLNYDEEALKRLRQTLLSATVENKTKEGQLGKEYSSQNRAKFYKRAIQSFYSQEALHEVLGILHLAKEKGSLNNNNIPLMIKNYFFEMNLVIHELSRLLTPGGHIIMVNDNVRYNGEEVPVDLILSNFAENAGLQVDRISVLARGKGNSSQQMGSYGRNELRKCVYIWRKPESN